MKATLALGLTFLSAIIASVKAADPGALPNTTYKLYQGWDKGHAFTHYTFETLKVGSSPLSVSPTLPIYKLVLNKNDDPHNTTQASIIDSIPGDPGYTDLWQIVKVVVPPGLPVIKSYTELSALVSNNTATLYPTETYVNCPVVGSASTLENPNDAVRVTGFYQGYNVTWFDFGPNPAGNATVPLYHVLINNSTTELTDSVPADSDYSAFWNIFVVNPIAADLTVNYTSVSQISKDNVTFAGILANCPIVRFDPSTPTSSSPSTTSGNPSMTNTSGSQMIIPSIFLSLAMAVFSWALA